MTPVDPIRFRELLGSFVTGVAIASARDAAGAPVGMTASAIASVSLEPPLLLVCVGNASDFHAVIAQSPHFGLSILADDQEHLSRRFATDMADRFGGVSWRSDATGVPLVDGAAAHIICARRAAHPAGDHTIFVGEVLDGATYQRPPLLHVRGLYGRLG